MTISELYSRRLLWCAVALGALLRIYHLGSWSLGVDDGGSFIVASQPLSNVVHYILQLQDVHPPLFFFWLHPFVTHMWPPLVSALGGLEAYCRWSIVPWAVALIPLTYILGCQLTTRGAAAVAALLVAVSNYLVFLAREVRMYPMLTVLLLLSCYLWLRASRDEGAVANRWTCALISVAAFLTHYSALFYLTPLFMYGMWRSPRVTIVPTIVLLMACAAWWHILHQQMWSQDMSIRPAVAWQKLIELLFRMGCGMTWPVPLTDWMGLALPWWKWAAAVALLAAVGGGLSFMDADSRWLALAWMVFPLAVLVGITNVTPIRIFEYKYFQPLLPFIFIAVGACLCRPWGVGICSMLIVVNLVSLGNLAIHEAFYGPQDWRSVLQQLAPQVSGGDYVLVHPTMMAEPLLVYNFTDPRFSFLSQPPDRLVGADRVTDAQLQPVAEKASRIWLLTTPYHPFVEQERLVEKLRDQWSVVRSFRTDSFWPANIISADLLERRAPR